MESSITKPLKDKSSGDTLQHTETATRALIVPINKAQGMLGGICRSTIYALLKNQRLSSIQIGSRRFITAASIERLASEPGERPAAKGKPIAEVRT